MSAQIERLHNISRRKSRLIIGLMSGTSLDGLDVALCRIEGNGHETRLELLQFVTREYDDVFRIRIRTIFAQRQIDQQQLSALHAYVGRLHGRMVNETLSQWGIRNEQIDLIASHGQTVYHAPQSLTGDMSLPNSTLQIGDGDHIAVETGVITISDFRQKHVAAGGEGAPLAAYGDFLLYSSPDENRILLNIGGISNLTFLPKRDSGGQAFATDIGPGNTMMNQFMLAHYDQEMDIDGAIAASGKLHQGLLDKLLEETFLTQEFPKTTGPELFNLAYLQQRLDELGEERLLREDIMATLNAFSARAICLAIQHISAGLDDVVIYGSGGGIHNPVLIETIKRELPHVQVKSIAALGMDPDAKEACLFAVLANETIAGGPNDVSNIKASPAVCMGKISLPR